MKKGISEIISWVLLIGFAVSLAAIVTIWTLRNTEQTTEGVVKMVTKAIRCSDAFINLGVDCTTKTLTIKNDGRFKIEKLIIRTGVTSNTVEQTLRPNEDKTLYKRDFTDTVEVVPLLKLDKEFIGCSDKSKEVKC